MVGIRNEGNGIGQIGVSGSGISYNGVVIGTFSGGVGSTLFVTFNASATAPAIDALIQNLTYANTSQDPLLTRNLLLNITDDEGASLVITPTITHGFTELTGAADPLSNPDKVPTFGAQPNPGFVDVDSDGDLDMVMGDVAGTFRYFQRSGSTYTEITGASNPFNGFDVGSYANPEAIDIDGDGDLDLVTGAAGGIPANNGTLLTWRNNGAGSWTQLVGAGVNPFNGVDVGSFSDGAAVDVNGDGRMDLVVGNQAGTIDVLIHNADHSFTRQLGAANPFNGIDLGSYSSPAGIDVDGDGDTDVLFGNNSGTIRTFINNGGIFTEATGGANPFDGIDVGSFSNLSAADLNGDGDRDLVVGDLSGGDTRVFDHVINVASSPIITITVNAQNDAPSGTDNEVTISEGGTHVFTVAEFGYSDIDNDAFSAIVISSLPVQGSLRYNGVAVVNGQVITVADINAGLLTFTGDPDESGPNYATFGFRVRDNGGGANGGVDTDPTPNIMTIAATPDNSPPRLDDLDDSVTFAENLVNTTPQILDFDVTFNDPDDNFNGGTLTVSGLLPEDVVGINDEGAVPNAINVSPGLVFYGGMLIGTVSGGQGATLTVTFNANATSEAVEALIENLTYANTSDQPTASRTLTLNVTDAAGADLAFQTSFEFAGVGPDNPFDGLSNGGSYSTPTFLDVDGDGDLDMVSGGNTGAIFYYRNDGGVFAEVPGSQNPFNGIDIGAFSVTAAINVDTDGDLDLVVGDSTGLLQTFRNNGNGTFTLLAGVANPFNGVDLGAFSGPTGGDIDGDGEMDLVAGNDAGTIATFRNNGNGTFTQLTGANNPFNGIDVGGYSSISLFDIDGDGDLDALLGNSAGAIIALNNGGAFTPAEAEQNPFDGLSVGYGAVFGFADLDGDGDLDAVVGSNYGDFLTFENTTPHDASIVVNVTAQDDIVELYDENEAFVESYSTIQRALDAAANDYTLLVTAGTHSGTLHYDDNGLQVIAQTGAVLNATFLPSGSQGIVIFGADAADSITTGTGNDLLSGGGGADLLTGGAGNDSYFVDSAADAVVEDGGNGTDVVYAAAGYILGAGASVEVLGTVDNMATTAINLTGNERDNYVVGNAGVNVLDGGSGGSDQLWGREGDDSYLVDADDYVVEYAGHGYDTVYARASHTLLPGFEIEVLATADNNATTAINLTGNEFSNYLVGNAGANTLDGGAGGIDQLWGREGDDSYFVDSNDLVVEYAGHGNDIVYARADHVLSAGFEIEVLGTADNTATTAISLKGNELSNYVTGNAGANTIDGGAGSDYLEGRGGVDSFAFTTALGANNVDQIADFVSGTDKIALDDAIFAGIGTPGSFNANAFFAGAAAHDLDDRIIYNQATGQLLYDADGSGDGAAVLFGLVAGLPNLTAADFTVI